MKVAITIIKRNLQPNNLTLGDAMVNRGDVQNLTETPLKPPQLQRQAAIALLPGYDVDVHVQI